MYRKLCALGLLGLAGYGGYVLWNKYNTDDSADAAAEDDYWSGLNFGITGWSPQLPIHSRSKTPTQGVYPAPTVYARKYKPGDMIPQRSQDYMNPAQLVPTTGPGNIAPQVGINTEFIYPTYNPNAAMYTEEVPFTGQQPGGDNPWGWFSGQAKPLVIRNPSGNFAEDRSVVTNG